MSTFRLVTEKMGIFLVPDCSNDHKLLAEAAAKETEAMIKQFDPNTMMVLPLTIPADWGTFLFGKVTVCSWTGLKTPNKDGVEDVTFQDDTLKALEVIQNKRYTLPDFSQMEMWFLLGMQTNDAKLNGPVIVARNLEPIRSIIDGVREELGLAALHPDSKIHVSMCRLTGRNAAGNRDDQLLRDRVQPHWPLLSNGFPDTLSAMPLDDEA
jgi:hypothetical protein